MKRRLIRCRHQPAGPAGWRLGRQDGLTLLELLLTVVIFSLVIAIFSEALFQIGLFARSSSRTAGAWQQRWQTGYVLDDHFASLVMPPSTDAEGTQGTDATFTGWWVEQSGPAAGLPVRVRLALRPLDGAATSAGREPWGLFLGGGAAAQDALVARWDRRVSFLYAGTDGTPATRWPSGIVGPADPRFEVLPRSVWVVDDAGAIAHAWQFDGQVRTAPARGRDTYAPGGGTNAAP